MDGNAAPRPASATTTCRRSSTSARISVALFACHTSHVARHTSHRTRHTSRGRLLLLLLLLLAHNIMKLFLRVRLRIATWGECSVWSFRGPIAAYTAQG